MLDLDSPKWKSLSHAYGSAEDIPELLRKLEVVPLSADPESEPWFSLWSSLCHQSDVYTASYAALPHVVVIAAVTTAKKRLDLLHFAASIEACRHRRSAPAMPPFLRKAYRPALEQAAALTLECLGESWDEKELAILLGAFAIFRGQARLGNAMMELPEESSCPACESTVPPLGYDLNDQE